MFLDNHADTYAGGGIHVRGSADMSLQLLNCTFQTNESETSGAGIQCNAGDEVVTIRNSILYDNEDDQGGIGYSDQVYNCDETITFSAVRDITETGHNINDDPELDGSGRIEEDSPCRDVGDNTDVEWEEDIEGNPRIVNDVVDMGVNELRLGACCLPTNVCIDVITEEACEHAYVCDVDALRTDSATYGDCGDDTTPNTGCCYGDLDGNSIVNPGDRGFVMANLGQTDPELLCLFDVDGNGTINAGDRGFVSANYHPPGDCTPLPNYMNGSGLNGAGTGPDPRFAGNFQGLGVYCADTTCTTGEDFMGGGSGGPDFDLDDASEGWYSIMVDAGEICLDGAAVFGVSDKEETVIDDASGGSLTSLGELLGSAGASPSPLFGAGFARRDMVMLESLSSTEEADGELCQVLPASGVILRLEVYVWRVNEDDTIDA